MQRRLQDGEGKQIDQKDIPTEAQIRDAETTQGPAAARALRLKLLKAQEQQNMKTQKETLNKCKQLQLLY